MRLLFSIVLLPLAACGGGKEQQADPAPAPRATGPAPRTPVMQVTPAPGNNAAWIEPREAANPPPTAPYGNLLDQPVVKGSPAT